MKHIKILLILVVILTGFTFTQERPDKSKEMIITPDGKLMSRIDGSISEPNYNLNTLKNNILENDAPIGTPFSWDAGLGFYSFEFINVYAIAVSGSDIYIGGDFTGAMGDTSSNYIVRYNQKNNTWHPLGLGLNGPVHAIAVSGNDVYIGGDFTDAGGNSNANRIARWDGSNWNAFDVGLNDVVYAIAISGSNVYVGGDFTSAGGIFEADFIARWNGSWNSMGVLDGGVRAIVVNGSYLYVGGYFNYVNYTESYYFATYNGSSWGSLGTTPLDGGVQAIAISGSDLYIGGAFKDAGGNTNADAVAYLDLSIPFANWQALGNGIINLDWTQNSVVNSMAVSGEDLYVGGPFNQFNSNFQSVAYWNGTSWDSLNSNLFGGCSALALSGTDVFAGGFFGLQRRFGAYAEGLYAGVQKSAASGSGSVEFNTFDDSTRITLVLNELGKGNGIFNVFCYEDKPEGGTILPVSNHRWIIQNTGFSPTVNPIDVIRIKFSDFADSSGITNPNSVQIYHRPTPGRGQFSLLYTEYDSNTNELWAYIDSINSYGEFAIGIPSTVDGAINTNEYGSHIDGQNQQLSDGKTWYMRIDEYYMYFGISSYTDSSEAVNIYLDNSGISPVNVHFDYYGTQTGTGKDGLSTNLPFGADFIAYVKPANDEYRHSNQFGGWMGSVANSFIRSYNDAGKVFEFAIPLSSLPVSTSIYNYPLRLFNWLGFLSNSVNISSRVPNNANPTGIADDLSWYYPSSVYSFPFARASYTHIGPSNFNFGAFDCYDFTFYPQDPATSINRTSGEWNIEDDLWVYGGTLTFQNPDTVNVGSFFISGVRSAPATTNFSYGSFDAPLVIKYRLDNRGDSTVIFMDSGQNVIFSTPPDPAYALFISDKLFQNIVIDNPYNVLLASDMKINESLTLQSGNIQTDAFFPPYIFYVILNPGAIIGGPGYVEGSLVQWVDLAPGPNGGDSPDNLVVNFPVGTANGPSPVSVDFSNVTTAGKLTVEAYQSIQPNTFDSSKTLQRYWKITKDNNLAFTTANITFNYRPEDFNGTTFSEATDEASMIVGKYDASWSYPSIFTRTPGGINDGGSITISGVTSFSDFTMFKSQLSANVKVFLEGPFASGSMTTNLGGNIPLAQPYSGAPWAYNGTESVAGIPAGVVDWVLLELRSNTTTQVARRAAFLRSNGSLVDLNGTSNVSFPGVPAGNYYLVIYHRNHLPIMTANPVQVSNNPTLFDLSTGQGQAYGTNAMKDLGGGVYGLYTADTDGSGTVNASDRSNTWNQRNLSGYYGTDVDLSGTVNAADRSSVWNNRNITTQVPAPVSSPIIEIVKEE